MIEDAKKKEEEPFLKKHRFKAKKVPKKVKEPLYNQIVKNNKDRR